MEDQEIIESLVKHFGEDAREEIQDSFQSGVGGQGTFTADGDDYEWIVSDEEAHRIAVEQVKNDLETEPEIFNQDWLSSHVTITDTDRRVIANEESDSRMEDMRDAVRHDTQHAIDELDVPEEFQDDPEEWKGLDDAIEKYGEKIYDEVYEALKDPIEYFVNEQGIYTQEELIKQSFISIDFDEAAEDAVNTDGWPHFLSHYDGNYEELPNGVVFFRS